MCSIMGYCSEAADYEQFRKGFDKTLSRHYCCYQHGAG